MTQTPVELPEMMQVAVVTEAGGPENFQWREVPVPMPSANQVWIETAATGLNFIETYQRSGLYDVPYPFIPGSEASGTVVAVGDQVGNVTVGDRRDSFRCRDVRPALSPPLTSCCRYLTRSISLKRLLSHCKV